MHLSRDFRPPASSTPGVNGYVQVSSTKPIALGLGTIAVLIIGVVGWAAAFPIATSVTTAGSVIIQGDRKNIQHPDGGVVSQILVADGDLVKAGQTLLKLDDTHITNLLASAGDQLAGALEQEARLAAQLRGERDFRIAATEVTLPKDALERLHGREHLLLRQIWRARDAQVATLEHEKTDLIVAAEGFEQLRTVRQEQLMLLEQEGDRVKQLARSGDEPKSRADDVKRAILESLSVVVELTNHASDMRSKAEDTRLEENRAEENFVESTASDRLQADRAVADARARYDDLQDQRRRLTISAPQAGTIIALNVHGPGAVVDAGAVLMQIVPSHGVKVIEGHVSPSDVSGIRVGAVVRCRATSEDGEPAYFEGEVVSVSADRLKETNETPFFRIETSLGKQFRLLASLRVGASVDMMISTGKETPVEKALAPLVRWFEAPR